MQKRSSAITGKVEYERFLNKYHIKENKFSGATFR